MLIDTNNMQESYHRMLKEVYLSTLKKQRVDVLVYVLYEILLCDIMDDHIRTQLSIRAVVLNKSERQRRRVAYSYSGTCSYSMTTKCFIYLLNYSIYRG